MEGTEDFVIDLNLTLSDSIPEEVRNRIGVCGNAQAQVTIFDSDRKWLGKLDPNNMHLLIPWLLCILLSTSWKP